MKWSWPKRKHGTLPDKMVGIGYTGPAHMVAYQTRENYPWYSVPAHETRAALTNAWQGNQLPGPVNFIPGVALSRFTWNVPTSYMNSLKNQQYNAGFNIMGQGSVQQAAMNQAIQQAWQNRSGM